MRTVSGFWSRRSVRLAVVLVGIVGGFSIVSATTIAAPTELTVRGVTDSTSAQCPPGSAAAFCASGTFSGDLVGPFDFMGTTLTPSQAASTMFFAGKSIVHTATGELFTDDAGGLDLASGTAAFVATITGGTGSWQGAVGQLVYRTRLEDGGRVGDYEGRITLP